MIKIKTQNSQYDVPTNFDEINWTKYVQIIKMADENIIKRLINITGINEDELLNLSVSDFIKICETVSFTDITFVAERYATGKVELNIGKEKYGYLEIARQEIIQSKNWVLAGQKVVLTYLKEDISLLPLPIAMGKVKSLFELINEFLDKFKKLYDGEVEAEEVMAGVEVFNKFGAFPTIDRLAIAYGKTHDEVLEMPAEIVMTKLLYDMEKNEYQERLMKIKSTK